MSDTDQTITDVSEASDQLSQVDGSSAETQDTDTDATGESASLGQLIPRPATSLDSPPKGDVGKFTVMLLGEVSSAPVLEDIEQTNRYATSEARTPLMAVILAILAKNGGTMLVEDLAAQVGQYWNRSFPTSPFTTVEFVYVLVRSSDNVRVREQ